MVDFLSSLYWKLAATSATAVLISMGCDPLWFFIYPKGTCRVKKSLRKKFGGSTYVFMVVILNHGGRETLGIVYAHVRMYAMTPHPPPTSTPRALVRFTLPQVTTADPAGGSIPRRYLLEQLPSLWWIPRAISRVCAGTAASGCDCDGQYTTRCDCSNLHDHILSLC